MTSRRIGRASSAAADLARGLGWFGIGLGAIEVIAPRALSRSIGMRRRGRLVAGFGVREIANGAALLAADDPTPWIWARVGGDALDIATLLGALATTRRRRGNAVLALAAVAGVTALDVACAVALSSVGGRATSHRDYSGRRGMPEPPQAMRGRARDLEVPKDMRIPKPMRPYSA
ncbi:MAG TPA: cyclase dehydrase [Acetobacteraceae bacterium]|nr:cyclase dehydrase [Acetobacteraceae bacterium]